ncbi:ABC transporter ATP-binding protein [Microbacterium amylolyticum]|uniref:Spermidine/putrescine transport system ATP-binding protein n=1 Tax=Microbacterium amylolyticum TaxID=936337 RepID=A0ABS4ZDP3_9MICO|nr:ABC transporter ATP-binding protein [Microbacterium amylolyticum]MBP2435418.1 putative spermidine/putrescine transport system ATP-binding protein [Microbacterium amylolyticum]
MTIPATANNDVVLENVTKTFGTTTVLKDMSVRIAPGELLSVLGPSGCGKTTALRILAGFEKPTSGRVLVGGDDVTHRAPNRRDIGMVFQAYSLFPNLSVLHNVEYGLRIRRLPSPERRRRANDLLEMCGLDHLATRFPHQLSGGQQQRVALARALAVQPSVLLLDEPLSALDAIVRAQIRDEIRRLQQQLGITTMFVTHDQGEALAIADRVAVLNGGHIEQIAAPQDVYQRPASEFVARFVGTVTEVGARPEFAGGPLPLVAPSAGLDTLFVRPEDVELRRDADGDATVTEQTYLGERTIVSAVTPEGFRITSSVSAAAASSISPGTRVRAHVSAAPALRLPSASGARNRVLA